MRTMFIAAATVLSLGVGSAYASENAGQVSGYAYPDYQFPTPPAPPAATAQGGEVTHTYITNSSRGTWLFAPNQNQGSNS